MAVTTADKAQLVQKFQRKPGDTGSTEVQVALLTSDIQQLTKHLQAHKHDCHTRYGLQQKVNARRRLLNYLKRTGFSRYLQLIGALELRH